MVTVVIPAYNEAATIRQVIQTVKKSATVGEIIVIDDKSTDATVTEAEKEQVKIFTSASKGKGISMREGILLAQYEIIAFVDADITTYPDDVIDRLSKPIIDEEADFVKSYFERQAGRVTELVAKPLLSFLFPSISDYKQPLSGMIAGKKSLLEKLTIEEDYGVDIGILIDMHKEGARIKEVSLGYIENRMQSIMQLGKMSREVTRAILKRSEQVLDTTIDLFTGELFQTKDPQLDFAVKEQAKGFKHMAIFELDKTILDESFIRFTAKKYGFEKELNDVLNAHYPTYLRIKHIAGLLKGLTITDILKTADEIPLLEDAKELIDSLRAKGYVCGIVSESFDVVAQHIANKLGMHFSLANELELHKSVATGEVKIPSFFLKNKNSVCKHDYCKSNAVLEIANRYGIDRKNIMAMGNSKQDVCMIQTAGTGVAVCTDNKKLLQVSDYQMLVPKYSFLFSLFL
jgi:glucosyl-3-phosphoglycerate synthase